MTVIDVEAMEKYLKEREGGDLVSVVAGCREKFGLTEQEMLGYLVWSNRVVLPKTRFIGR